MITTNNEDAKDFALNTQEESDLISSSMN
jgi:hypothetical protein